jgi:nitroreductase
MEVIKAIKDRHTYRGMFQDRKVDKATLLQLIEAARWAPSGHNSQPWNFLVIDDKKMIRELVAIATDNFNKVQKTRKDVKKLVQLWWQWLRWSEEELEAVGDGMYMHEVPQALWEEMIKTRSIEELRLKVMEVFSPEKRASQIIGSPCVIFALLNKARKIPNFSQDVMELTSIGAAIQNLRLAVHSLGLAAHEVSLLYDLPQTRQEISERLGIPPHYQIVSAMRIGYPGKPSISQRTDVRRPLEKLVHWNHY